MTDYVVSSGQPGTGLVLSNGDSLEGASGGTAHGTIVHSGGAQSLVTGAMVFASVLSGGELDNYGTAVSAGSPDFVFSGGIEHVTSGGTASGSIVHSGGILDIGPLAFTSAGSASVDAGTNILTVTKGGQTHTQHLLGDDGNTAFIRGAGDTGGTRLLAKIACYAVGTHILTTGGEVRIERLRPGQRLVLEDGGTAPLLWVGERAIDCTRHETPEKVWPVRILRDALAPGVPHRDLVLSPEHAIYHEGTLIPVRTLINGATVVQEQRVWVHYLHVELDRHGVVIAEGLPAESWLDGGKRGMFGNAPEGTPVPESFDPDPGVQGCAPRADTGPAVQSLKQSLLARAMALGFTLAHDPDLHVLIDGRRYELADAILQPGVREVLIVSRTGVPRQQTPASTDPRALGVMLSGIVLRDGYEERRIRLNHPALDRGFSEPEHDDGQIRRWTTGAAALSPLFWAGMTGPVRLELEVHSTFPIWREPPELAPKLELAGA